MNNPTPDTLQRFMAEKMGYKQGSSAGKGCKFWNYPDGSQHYNLPDWPGDRNATKDLPIEVEDKEQRAAGDYEMAFFEALNYYGWHPACLLSAFQECLIWILYKGYKWVECDYYEGQAEWRSPRKAGEMETCPICSGQGGEFVKEVVSSRVMLNLPIPPCIRLVDMIDHFNLEAPKGLHDAKVDIEMTRKFYYRITQQLAEGIEE